MKQKEIEYLSNFIKQSLPIRQKRQLEDLMVYKKNIILLRQNCLNNFCSLITYIKKKTQQVKKYQIQLHTYYYKRDTNQTILIAKDINDLKHSCDKTFILQNILNVETSNVQVKQKNIKIN